MVLCLISRANVVYYQWVFRQVGSYGTGDNLGCLRASYGCTATFYVAQVVAQMNRYLRWRPLASSLGLRHPIQTQALSLDTLVCLGLKSSWWMYALDLLTWRSYGNWVFEISMGFTSKMINLKRWFIKIYSHNISKSNMSYRVWY